jgi:hypothetical protein
MTPDDLIALELMLNRFNRLMTEVFRGGVKRNAFQPWEIDILLDMDNCELRPRRRLEVLRQYQKAVQRQMEKGPGPPMKLSEYLERTAMRAARRREAAEPAGSSPKPAPHLLARHEPAETIANESMPHPTEPRRVGACFSLPR